MEMYECSNLEKRKFPRLKDNIFIFGNLRSSPAEEFKAITKDISAGGVMFETERDIPEESEWELEIYQPTGHHKNIIFSIPVLIRVVWRKEIEKENFQQGENKYKVGIQFTEIKEEDRQKIVKFVEENKS